MHLSGKIRFFGGLVLQAFRYAAVRFAQADRATVTGPYTVTAMLLIVLAPVALTQTNLRRPVDYANPLVGTAPLDDQKLIGNAPPAGEQLYSGFTSPGAALPHSATDIAPVNANLPLSYPAGVPAPYYYPNPAMVGFSSGERGGPILMPVVGDWTVPPQRTVSYYDKAREHASPGYYSVYLDTFKTGVELTATTWTGLYRITYPASNQSHLLLDLGPAGGSIEVAGDHTIRGYFARGRNHANTYFVAQFSKPFTSFGTFRQFPPRNGEKGEEGSILGGKEVDPGQAKVSGPFAGAYLNLTTTSEEQVLVKIARGTSYEQAEQRLQSEDPGWDFDRVHRDRKSVV